MSAKVFLSCGQSKAIKLEIETANAIKQRLLDEFGLDVFLSVNENFFDGNPSFFDALKNSDYFLFVNFKRPVENPEKDCYFSLYTHQELAMARAFGFDETNMLIFHQRGMAKDGILKYMFANIEFDSYSDVVELIAKAVRANHWSSNYSRKLVVKSVSINPHIDDWRDKNGTLQIRRERMALVEITNRRNDYAAINCQVHLRGKEEQYLNYDRAPIKAAGVKAYSHTIWPGETVQFDLFGYDVKQKKIFMHTECDVSTPDGLRKPLLASPGDFILTYEVYAEHFPVSTFDVKLHLGDDVDGGIEMSLCENLQPEQPSVDSPATHGTGFAP
jgi:hypothetical protein